MRLTARVTRNIHRMGLVLAVSVLWIATPVLPDDPAEVQSLLQQAELLILMGTSDQGASRYYEMAGELLDRAARQLESDQMPDQQIEDYRRQLETVREDLEIVTELAEERFFGVFPLARLTKTSLLDDEGLSVSEQMFHPPEVAAVLRAAQRVSRLFSKRDSHPHVVFRSLPPNRMLENIAAEVLAREGVASVHTRRQTIDALDQEQLAAFDSGHISPELVDQLSNHLNAVNLVILSLRKAADIENGSAIWLDGSINSPGEVVQGSPLEASISLQVENFSVLGFARDRRDQYWPILATGFLLLLIALISASRTRWKADKPFRMAGRLVIGALLYFYGKLFMSIAISLMRRSMPDETALLAAAWWWPAIIGILAIVLVGLLAWIGQARLTNIVPGMRGARAVGTIFALSAMGAASYFLTPLLLLDGIHGLANFIPFLIASLSLALLFGFAARTGPPVPHYFMVFPVLIAPLVGTCLFMASTPLIWLCAAVALVPCLAAWLRHRKAVAEGWEEPEPTDDEAAQADQQNLMKLRQKFKK